MSRRPLVLVGLVALMVGLTAGCSSSDGSSASNDSTTTTDYNQGQQKQNLDQFAKDVENRQGSSVAMASSPPISIWATFLREYDNDQPLTVRHDGDNLRICGVGQPDGGCAELSNFTFDAANRVDDLDFEGIPIRTLLSGAGISGEYATGDFASVALHEAFLNPTSQQLYVSLGLIWDPERFPETGCDPAIATYSKGGQQLTRAAAGSATATCSPPTS